MITRHLFLCKHSTSTLFGTLEKKTTKKIYFSLGVSGVRVEADGEADGQDGEQLAQTPITTSPSASSTTSFMSSSLEDTTTATTPVTDTETVPVTESPGVMPLSLLRSEHSSLTSSHAVK